VTPPPSVEQIRDTAERVLTLAENATEGPWFANEGDVSHRVVKETGIGQMEMPRSLHDDFFFHEPDAKFIAACRTDAPLLAAWATKVAEALEGWETRQVPFEDGGHLSVVQRGTGGNTETLIGPTYYDQCERLEEWIDQLRAVLSVGGGNKADE
jgi:hypothetical protein